MPRRLPPFPEDSSIATSISRLQFYGAILFFRHWQFWTSQPRVVSRASSWTSMPFVWLLGLHLVLWSTRHTISSRHISAVESLIILSLNFSYDQVASTLTGPKTGRYRLTALSIRITCFSPVFLSLLVDNAPQLRSLKLNISAIGPDKQPESFSRNSVVAEVSHSLFSVPQNIIIHNSSVRPYNRPTFPNGVCTSFSLLECTWCDDVQELLAT